jgi:hypothetical protein
VSFRPGRLRTLLSHRAVRELKEGQVAKRDLARYYLLLGRVLLDDRLTRREAAFLAKSAFDSSVADLLSGDPFIPEYQDPSEELLRIASRARRTSPIGSDIADSVLRKVEEMTPLERAALLDAIDRLPAESEEEFWDPGNWALIGIRLAEDE